MAAAKKNLRLSVKPSAQETEGSAAETWVDSRNGGDLEKQVVVEVETESVLERFKRITFEVSERQHQRVKIYAASKGISIKELMIELVEQELNKDD